MKIKLLLVAIATIISASLYAAEFNVSTAQELQSALTTAASNGEDDTIILAAGYYVGNLIFSTSEAKALTLRAADGVGAHEVSLDGNALGRALEVRASTAAANLTISGITLVRNCNNTDLAALEVATAGNLFITNCQAIATGTMKGWGIRITKANNATIADCIITRTVNTFGDGIVVNGVTGQLLIERNVIDGANSANNGRGINIAGTATQTTVIRHNRLTNNYNTFHGGCVYIYIGAGSLELHSNYLCGNKTNSEHRQSDIYGNVYIQVASGGQATVSNNIISHNIFTESVNTTYPYGAGLALKLEGTSAATIIDNQIEENQTDLSFTYNYSSVRGAGVLVRADSKTTVEISRNTIRNNLASSFTVNNTECGAYGAGIYAMYGKYTLKGNILEGNKAYSNKALSSCGGGLYVYYATDLTLENNKIINNESKSGGGVYIVANNNIVFNGNLLHGNSQIAADAAGGAIWMNAKNSLKMLNNTITDNSGAGMGGGAYFSIDAGCVANVHNNIIWGNSAAGDGGDIYLTGASSSKFFNNNCAGDIAGIWDYFNNNIDVDPKFHDTVNHDYHLTSSSLCIDAGDATLTGLPEVDMDGEPRVVNDKIDIGADEVPAVTDTHPADLDADWVISAAEYADYAAAWKTNGVWLTPPSPVTAAFATRAGFLQQQENGAYKNIGGKKPICWVPDEQ